MIFSIMVLISSAALGLLYLQAACENVLRREFDSLRLRTVANGYCLEFPFVRKEMERTDGSVDYRWVDTALKCDYLVLKHLLANTEKIHSRGERLLILYFRALFLALSVQHRLKFNEKWAVLKLSTILEHLAGLLGERAHQIQFDSITV